MERPLLCSGSSRVKSSWERENDFKFDKDYPYGYPWPPRYYTCSFCQREFKSAQALGGHMNIHRRDRARLNYQSLHENPVCSTGDSDKDNFNPNPNANTNPSPISFSSPSPPTNNNNNNVYAHQYSLVSLSLSSLPSPTKIGEKLGGPTIRSGDGFGRDSDQGVGKWNCISSGKDYHEHEVMVFKSSTSTKDVVSLDLELCLGEAKEGVDLELRLGI